MKFYYELIFFCVLCSANNYVICILGQVLCSLRCRVSFWFGFISQFAAVLPEVIFSESMYVYGSLSTVFENFFTFTPGTYVSKVQNLGLKSFFPRVLKVVFHYVLVTSFTEKRFGANRNNFFVDNLFWFSGSFLCCCLFALGITPFKEDEE